MHIDRLSFLPPGSSSVFEVANQLFLLAIHTDDRPAGGLKDLPLAGDELELRLAIRVGTGCLALFRIHPQRVAQLAQHATHRGRTGRMTPSFKRSERWRRLLRTHFCSLMGSPAVSGSTSPARVLASAGSFFRRGADRPQAAAPAALVALPENWPTPAVHAGWSFHPDP